MCQLCFRNLQKLFLIKGNQQLSSGKLDDAEESFNKAMQLDPSFAPAMQALSKLSLHRGDLKKANEFSIKAVQADEDFRDWSLQISKISEQIQNGNRNVQQGLFNDAISSYESILKDHPYFPDAEFYMGLTRFRQKGYRKGRKAFQ